MMVIERRFDTEEMLQEAMDTRGMEEVLAANDMGNSLQCIVDHDGKMVARRHVPARDDDVTPILRPGRDGSASRREFPSRRAARQHVRPRDPCSDARKRAPFTDTPVAFTL